AKLGHEPVSRQSEITVARLTTRFTKSDGDVGEVCAALSEPLSGREEPAIVTFGPLTLFPAMQPFRCVLPMAADPNVLTAFPIPPSIDPDGVAERSRATSLNAQSRRRRTWRRDDELKSCVGRRAHHAYCKRERGAVLPYPDHLALPKRQNGLV